MRFTLGLCLAASLAAASPAGAVLKRYGVHWTTISEFNTANPSQNKYPPTTKDGSTQRSGSFGIIDDAGGGSPVLKKLALISDFHQTSCCFGFDHYIFLSRHAEEGPRKGLDFTGEGDTSTTIAWGVVTGWTITGGTWCNSDFPFLCTFELGGVGLKYLATVDPQLYSSHYDLGTWTFHGTGFTSVPFVHQAATPASMAVGNIQYLLRGRLAAGLVPAVPVLGVALLGASLLLAGARLSRGR